MDRLTFIWVNEFSLVCQGYFFVLAKKRYGHFYSEPLASECFSHKRLTRQTKSPSNKFNSIAQTFPNGRALIVDCWRCCYYCCWGLRVNFYLHLDFWHTNLLFMPMMIISEKNMQFYNYTFYGLFESSHYTSTCEFTEFALVKMMQRFFTAQVQSVFATIDHFRPVLAKKTVQLCRRSVNFFTRPKLRVCLGPKISPSLYCGYWL